MLAWKEQTRCRGLREQQNTNRGGGGAWGRGQAGHKVMQRLQMSALLFHENCNTIHGLKVRFSVIFIFG